MKRKIKFLILLILIIMCTTLLSYAKINKEKVNSSNGMFAIFLEEEKDSGKYQKSNLRTWPTDDEYVINISKSYCENGSVLRWNNETKKIRLKVTGTDKCYIYFDKGEYGTIKNPHLIQTIEDLVRLSNNVNKGTNYAGEYFLLTTDLDFENPDDYENANRTDFGDINGINGDEPLIKELTTGSGFVPIGKDAAKPFSGNFDGGNHKISNLYIVNNTVDTRVGFFSFYGMTSSKETLEINNLTLDGQIRTKVVSGVGGLIACLQSNVNINNCHIAVNVTSEVPGRSNAGIIAAIFNPCVVNINNSSYSGNLTGGTDMGGLVDYVGNGKLNIKNSYNKGLIHVTNGYMAGGLVGNLSSNATVSINNSYNEGKIINDIGLVNEIYLGGLIGYAYGNYTINKSYNTGDIINTIVGDTSPYLVFIGGLIGKTSSGTDAIIVNSYNSGLLKGGHEIGGIISQADTRGGKIIIDRCYNSGTIETTAIYGPNVQTTTSGFMYNASSDVYILNSYNTGNIEGPMVSSGIAYEDFGGTLYTINSYNTGTINGKQGASGLFTSTARTTNIINAYNTYNIGSLVSESGKKHGIFVSRNIITVNPMKVINNVYYENSVSASNVSGVEGTPMAIDDMKQQVFVDELNKNVDAINLEAIDSSLKGYTLSKWKMGPNNYPVLINE